MKKRVLAMLLSAVMLTVLFSGCGKAKNESSEISNTDVISNDSGENNATENTDSTIQSSDAQTSNSSTQTSGNKTTGIDYNSLKGTTVKVLMWRDLTDQEKITIANFEKEYSMKVKVDYSNQDNYMTKIASLVSTNDSPDVGVIINSQNRQGCFPIGAATVFQAASVTKQDLNDSFWDKDAMNNFKIKGKPYAFIAYKNWYNAHGVLMYNADMFKSDGITSPYDLWKAGNWNWDTLKSTAEALKKKGHKYGMVVNMVYNNMASAGTDFVSYDGSTFKSTITDAKTVKAWTFNAQMVEAGLQPVYGTDSNAFQAGEAGMFSTNLWTMRKDGLLNTCKFEVMCVPYPSPADQEFTLVPGSNLFAIPKGAKNPIGAGVFLRYLLDSKNNGNFADVSINPKMEEVFNYLNSTGLKRNYMMSAGVIGYSNLTSLNALVKELNSTTASQVTTVLQKNKSLVDNTVKSINSKLK